jgi:glutaminyl-tRNA synthetase
MVVFDPLKVIITNFKREDEKLQAENNPEDDKAGEREMLFGAEIFIERDDFMENPPKKYFRLAPGQMVRLKSAYIIKCDEVIKDNAGNITELHCSYIPESKSGHDQSGINVKGTLHWVNAKTAISIEIREYDRLFKVEDPMSEAGDFKDYVNSDSLKIISSAVAEPELMKAKFGDRYQFLRKGYFCLDKDTSPSRLIFNRTVTLKDSWAKEQKKSQEF